MTKPRIVLICVAAVLALIVGLPMTRWVVLNHFDVLSGRYTRSFGQDHWANLGIDLTPQFNQIDAKDLDSAFLVARREGASSVMELATKNPEMPALWAHTIRSAYSSKNYKLAGEAAMRGREVDPNNAYFSLVLAAVKETTGDHSAALAALEVASRGTSFEGYWMDHAEREIRALEGRIGYRGQFIRLQSYAGVAFPEYGGFNNIAAKVQGMPDIEPRRQLAKCGLLLVAKSDTLIGLMVGRRMVESAVLHRDDKPFSGQLASRIARAQERAKALDQTAGTTEFSEAADESAFVYDVYRHLTDDEWAWNRSTLIYGATALAALILALGIWAVAFRLAHLKTGPAEGRAMPHVVSFAAWLIAQYGLTRVLESPGAEAESMVGIIMLIHLVIAGSYAESRVGRWVAIVAASVHAVIAVLSALPYTSILFGFGVAAAAVLTLVGLLKLDSDRRAAFGGWVGFAVCAFALVVSSAAAVAWIPFAAYALSFFGSRFKLVAPVLIVIIASLGFLWVNLMSAQSDPLLSAAGFIAIVLLLAFYWRKPLSESPAIGATVIGVATLAYVIYVGAELRQDTRDRAMLQNFITEADRLRARVSSTKP